MKSAQNPNKPLILASQSSYKASLLSKLTDHYLSIAADIDESAREGESPYKLATRLATEKAKKIAHTHPSHWVLGCDQVAILPDDNGPLILNKPGNYETAFEQLSQCSGKRVEFFTACCLVNEQLEVLKNISDSFVLEFRTLNTLLIDRYLQREQPFDCAGSIKSEGSGVALVSRYEGNDPNTLVGLPLIELVKLFEKHGIVYL